MFATGQRRGVQAPGPNGAEHHRAFGLEERRNRGAHAQRTRHGGKRDTPGTWGGRKATWVGKGKG